jgi:cysteine synthase
VDILSAIGNTSIVRLSKVVPAACAEIFVKLEWQNPTGSMKDRMARTAISLAEQSCRLKPGDIVVEYSGGSTGASLALVCAAKGYRLQIVTSDAFSLEKRNQMRAYGADLTILPSEGGFSTKKLFQEMIRAAKELSGKPNTFWFNQLQNPDTVEGYYSLGEEIWKQTNGEVTAFVQAVGTGASSRGVATILKKQNPNIKVFGVEPAESPVLAGGQPGSHRIEGIGIGYTPELYDPSLIDGVIPISTDEAEQMARRLARRSPVHGNVLRSKRSRCHPNSGEVRSERKSCYAADRLRLEILEH